jgi:hypothetical protein
MSEEKNEQTQDDNDPKVKFRKALDKKRQGQGKDHIKMPEILKISEGRSGRNSPTIFRRKSGSA